MSAHFATLAATNVLTQCSAQWPTKLSALRPTKRAALKHPNSAAHYAAKQSTVS
jgi:hypothetical protein